jgi:hypothetical protein
MIKFIQIILLCTGWWLIYPSEKMMDFVSWDGWKFPTESKVIKAMFQTTNQILLGQFIHRFGHVFLKNHHDAVQISPFVSLPSYQKVQRYAFP